MIYPYLETNILPISRGGLTCLPQAGLLALGSCFFPALYRHATTLPSTPVQRGYGRVGGCSGA